MNGTTAYALSKQYVADTADSLGSLKGAPCTIKSQTETDDSYIVTFEWTGTSGAKETSQLTIKKPKDGIDGLPGRDGKDGSDGIGISKIEKIGTVDLVDTYRITFTDNSTFDYEVKNGKDGADGQQGQDGFSPTITENAGNTDKIYKLDITTADSTFTTPNLKGADGQGGTGGSGEENKIDSISVNGVNVAIDENKNVDITVPSIDGLATETYVDNKVADYTKTVDLADVATTGSYNDLNDKPEFETVNIDFTTEY